MLLMESVLFLMMFFLLAESKQYILDSYEGSELGDKSGSVDSDDKLLQKMTELGTLIAEMKTEFGSQIKEMKIELRSQMTEMKMELRSQMTEMKMELGRKLTDLNKKFDNQNTSTGTTTVQTTADPVKSTVVHNTTEGRADVEGFYFEGSPSTRLEYDSLPVSIKDRFVLSMEFRTKKADGVIFSFYGYGPDQTSVIIKEGRIRYTFNCGSGNAEIKSTGVYNDGNWHKLELERHNTRGLLKVDNELSPLVYSPGPYTAVNGNSPYYFGGIDQTKFPKERIPTNLDGVSNSFTGCIANIKVGNYKEKKLDVGTPSKQNGTRPCLDIA